MADNLLTANQASGTDTLSSTAGFDAGNATLLSDTAWSAEGARSLRVTASVAAESAVYIGGPGGASGTIPVTPGLTYTFQAFLRQAAATHSVLTRICWWTSAGNVAASPSNVTTTYTPLTAAGSDFRVSGVAPANAAFAALHLYQGSTSIGTQFSGDKFGFWAGTDTTWSMPGASGSFGSTLWPRDLQYQLNRLAGTVVNGVPQLSEQGAANVWAAIPGRNLGIQGALNIKAGILNPKDYLSVRAVCNQLGGTTNEDMAYALSRI